MKIYNKSAFITGVICSLSIPLLLLNIIPQGVIQWCLSLAITGRYLYIGLSKEAAKDNEKLSNHYKETAQSLYGKYYYLKTNLPLVLLATFFVPALLLRFVFDVYTPVWFAIIFVIALTVAVVYSIGVNSKIREHIRQNK